MSKLHAKDLMIGDWIMFPNSIEKVQEVSYIEGKGYCASFAASATLFPIPIDKLEPIPLTKEILEKNRWRKNDIFMIFNEDPNAELSWTNIYGACLYKNGYHICDCDYVHQLQHALRLCGIEKEVQL